ncbi:hypothetical protein ACHAXA_000561 [Cyclostephanos tholiformis]|uniref:Uncharacterized protein n=1 Tax=Cyclostephanos tholiformis TaxID=382380 RepID=A0ABD3STW7_9STRA
MDATNNDDVDRVIDCIDDSSSLLHRGIGKGRSGGVGGGVKNDNDIRDDGRRSTTKTATAPNDGGGGGGVRAGKTTLFSAAISGLVDNTPVGGVDGTERGGGFSHESHSSSIARPDATDGWVGLRGRMWDDEVVVVDAKAGGVTRVGTPARDDGSTTTTTTRTRTCATGDATSMTMGSPGGFDILAALSGANSYAHRHRSAAYDDDDDDDDGGGGGCDADEMEPERRDVADKATIEEWRDAVVHFETTRDRDYFDYDDDGDDDDDVGGGDGVDSTRQNLTNAFVDDDFASAATMIVEATRHANDDKDVGEEVNAMRRRRYRRNRSNRRRGGEESSFPVPRGLGVMDWSLKRRVRLECVPGRCLPFIANAHDEGHIQRLALLHLSGGDVDDDGGGGRSGFDRVMARWLASTMYYQHPAIHPLPQSLLSSSTATVALVEGEERRRRKPILGKRNDEISSSTGRDLSSYILGGGGGGGGGGGRFSIHDRVRLAGVGCMGGLGASMPHHVNNNNNNINNEAGGVLLDKSKGGRRKRVAGPPATIATVSSLLHQRRRDWQVAFRSAYQSWRSRLGRIEDRTLRTHTRTRRRRCRCDGNDALPTEDEASRCSFYSVSPSQVILFRGGCFVDGVDSRIVPVIVFSSTTPYLRSRLRSVGVNLRLFGNVEREEEAKGGKNVCHLSFSERLFDDDVENSISGGGDAELVHAELDAIKHADDDGGKVTVEVKTWRRRRRKYGKSLTDDGGCAVLGSPLFVSGDDDCAAVYELLLNTCGLSVVGPEMGKPKAKPSNDASVVPSDVPLSLGPCVMWTLRTLSVSSRRDCSYMNQVLHNKTKQQQPSSSKASLELRGPVLPCALRDMTCAMINAMLLDKSTLKGQSSIRLEAREPFSEKNGSNETNAGSTGSSTHQFVMFSQAHEGEYSISTPKSTGSSSTIKFNGSNIPLLPKNDDYNDAEEPLAWRECGRGERKMPTASDIESRSRYPPSSSVAMIPSKC